MVFSQNLKHLLTPSLWWLSDRTFLPGKQVRLTFRLKYSKARKVQWSRIDAFRWQVFFESTKSKHWVIYTNDAVCLEITMAIRFRDIPLTIQKDLELNNTTKPQHIYKIQTALKTIFEVQLLNGNINEQLVYDENGKMLGKMMTTG